MRRLWVLRRHQYDGIGSRGVTDDVTNRRAIGTFLYRVPIRHEPQIRLFSEIFSIKLADTKTNTSTDNKGRRKLPREPIVCSSQNKNTIRYLLSPILRSRRAVSPTRRWRHRRPLPACSAALWALETGSRLPAGSTPSPCKHVSCSDKNSPKLEIWGRAQHEAARRPGYDLKYILWSCKLCTNLRGQHPLRAEL